VTYTECHAKIVPLLKRFRALLVAQVGAEALDKALAGLKELADREARR